MVKGSSVKAQAVARLTHLVAIAVLWSVSMRVQFFWGLTYAMGMATLWALLEMALRFNPGMLNNPTVSAADRDLLMDLEPSVVGSVVAPVCISASIASALLGLVMTALVASTPNMATEVGVLMIPAGPMMIGIPLYILLGRLGDLAASARPPARQSDPHPRSGTNVSTPSSSGSRQ